jgi:hypothetical protein
MTWMRMGRLPAMALAAWMAGMGEAAAQAARPVAVEGVAGWAGFVDDATDHHALLGVSARFPVGRRLSVGPEVFITNGSSDRDMFVLGSLWVDLAPSPEQARVVPYVVLGGGYMRHSQRFGSQRFTSGDGSFTAGGGVRAHVNDRVYVGGDVRIGWELHLRTTAHIGVTWPRIP